MMERKEKEKEILSQHLVQLVSVWTLFYIKGGTLSIGSLLIEH